MSVKSNQVYFIPFRKEKKQEGITSIKSQDMNIPNICYQWPSTVAQAFELVTVMFKKIEDSKPKKI